MADWTAVWGPRRTLANCAACDGTFLLPSGALPGACPYCSRGELTPLDAVAGEPVPPPELLLPPSVPEGQLRAAVTRFARRSWFAPADLTPETLLARLQPLYLPMWLVDAEAQARWQAEAGFDYQVVSHRERFADGQWQTQEVRETRVRWEPRVGLLERPYANVPAPALDEQAQLERLLGRFDLAAAAPYAPEAVAAPVHLPNRAPADAWTEAQAALRDRAAAECRQAASADHLREFRWAPEFAAQQWTLLLLPLYTTHYRDDDGVLRRVTIHGQTGALRGERRASLRAARRWSLLIAAGAALLFALSLLVGLLGAPDERWLSLAGAGLTVALLAGITAVLPLLAAWTANAWGHAYDRDQQLLQELAAVAWRAEIQ